MANTSPEPIDQYAAIQPLVQKDMKDVSQGVLDSYIKNGLFDVTDVTYHAHNGTDSPQIFPGDLLGYTIFTSVPTKGAQTGQIIVVLSGTSYAFYVYAKGAWNKMGATSQVFGGQIAADGTGTYLPTGWSSAHTATGDYTITHNLGSSSYGLVATLVSAAARTVYIADHGANSFELYVKDTASAFQDTALNFILSIN